VRDAVLGHCGCERNILEVWFGGRRIEWNRQNVGGDL
jgi:hypothetical protein